MEYAVSSRLCLLGEHQFDIWIPPGSPSSPGFPIALLSLINMLGRVRLVSSGVSSPPSRRASRGHLVPVALFYPCGFSSCPCISSHPLIRLVFVSLVATVIMLSRVFIR